MATQQVPVLYNSADECNAEGASMTAFYTLAAHRSAIRCVGGRFACWHLYNGVQRPLSVEQPALHSDSCWCRQNYGALFQSFVTSSRCAHHCGPSRTPTSRTDSVACVSGASAYWAVCRRINAFIIAHCCNDTFTDVRFTSLLAKNI